MATSAMASSIAKEAENASTAGNNGVCSNEGSGENRCGNSTLLTEGRVCSKKLICYGCGQEGEKKLLQLWGIWTHGKRL